MLELQAKSRLNWFYTGTVSLGIVVILVCCSYRVHGSIQGMWPFFLGHALFMVGLMAASFMDLRTLGVPNWMFTRMFLLVFLIHLIWRPTNTEEALWSKVFVHQSVSSTVAVAMGITLILCNFLKYRSPEWPDTGPDTDEVIEKEGDALPMLSQRALTGLTVFGLFFICAVMLIQQNWYFPSIGIGLLLTLFILIIWHLGIKSEPLAEKIEGEKQYIQRKMRAELLFLFPTILVGAIVWLGLKLIPQAETFCQDIMSCLTPGLTRSRRN